VKLKTDLDYVCVTLITKSCSALGGEQPSEVP